MKNDKEIRQAVVTCLEREGFSVISQPGGQGARELSRVRILRDGESMICAIKTSTSGRISFVRDTDGTYKVLDEVDRVIHAHPMESDPSKIVVTMFDRATVRKAFDQNYKALTDHNMGHIPSWVNPEPESGWRQAGSGFKNEALWRKTIDMSADAGSRAGHFAWGAGDVEVLPGPFDAPIAPLSIKQAKEGLAAMFGVSPDKIEITIKG